VTDFGTLILEQTPDAVVLTRLDGEVVFWSNGACAVFGYTSADAVGRRLTDLIELPASGAAEEADAGAVLRQTLVTGAASYESLRRARDGTLVYIDSSSKLVRDADGAPEYILWSKKDVTALKVLRDAKLVEARFHGILDSMPDAIVVANATGRIVLANRQAEALFGYVEGALRGVELEALMPARLRAAHRAHRNSYAAQPSVRPMGEGLALHGLRSDGVEFPVEISLSPVSMEEGTLVISAIRDISERKQSELALQEKNIELAKANTAKDRFLGGMSHELRTPLNAIIGFTGTMLMKLPGPINVEQTKQLRMVQSSARHLLSLINDLLDLTRIETGKLELDPTSVDCRQLVDEVLALLEPQARLKGLAFAVVVEPHAALHPLTVHSDRRAMQQILMNLVGNAIRFTDGGTLQVRLAAATVSSRRCATISIGDTVEGDAPLRAVSQLDVNAMQQFEGAGLSLHLSQKLAALLHGEILFDSEYGVGSVFTLALPLET
jgi:PAS domain S-box-containing protein